MASRRRHALSPRRLNLQRHAASRRRHAVILRTVLAALTVAEISGQAGASPSLLEGGLTGLFELPFFAPALLGAFAAQVLLRPRPAEVAATLVAAAALAWPLLAAAASEGPFACIASALGLASLLVLGARAAVAKGDERRAVLDVLQPALILPGFVLLAFPMGYLTAALWPTTYDPRLYVADATFGAPLSFVVGRWSAGVPLLNDVCLAVYAALPLALIVVHALRRRQGEHASDVLVTFIAVTVVGYLGYHVVPVAGPTYAFPGLFPLQPPDAHAMSTARALALPMPRNCMPSLHSGWALLVFWGARPLSRLWRIVATLFLAITLLATVALGFHYVVDLVAAFPLTMAVAAWGTSTREPGLRRTAMTAGLAMATAWIGVVTWSEAFLRLPAVVAWMLAIAVVATSWMLERRVHAARSTEAKAEPSAMAPNAEPKAMAQRDEPKAMAQREEPSATASLPATGLSMAAALLGAAGFLHWAIVSNVLLLLVGSTSSVRLTLLASCLAGLAVGAVAAGRTTLATTGRLKAVALLTGALLATSWTWPLLLPVAWELYGDFASSVGADSAWLVAARVVMAIPGLVVEAALTGAAFVLLPPRMDAHGDDASHGLARAAGCFLLGTAVAALATGSVVIPSTYSQHLPLTLYGIVTILVALLATWSARLDQQTAHDAEPEDAAPTTLPTTAPWPLAMPVLAGVLVAVVAVAHASLFAVVFGDTTQSRAQLPFVLSLGLAVGLIATTRLPRNDAGTRAATVWVLTAFAAALGGGLSLWSELPEYFASFRGYFDGHNMMKRLAERELVRLFAGSLFLLPPAALLGALLSLSWPRTDGRSQRSALRVSSSALVATLLAATAGTLVAAFALLPMLGSRAMLLLAAFAALAAGTALLATLPRGWTAGTVAALMAAAAVLAFVPGPVDPVRLASGSARWFAPQPFVTVTDSAEHWEGFVAVVDTGAEAQRRRWPDGKRTGKDAERGRLTVAASEAHSDGIRLVKGRERALAIGLATAAVPRLLQGAGFKTVVFAEPNAAAATLGRLRLFGSDDSASVRLVDGRSLLLLDDTDYDFVVLDEADVSNPDVASQHTREFYATAARRLRPGGVLQQQLDLEHLSALGLTSVLASARQVFDAVWVHVSGESATLVACSGECAMRAPSPSGASLPSASGWSLDPAATDRLLLSGAERLGVDADALASTDLDLFLRYHTPSSFLRAIDAEPESLALLRQIAGNGNDAAAVGD
jgi:hypothetical protein